jgi:hypothetical protein
VGTDASTPRDIFLERIASNGDPVTIPMIVLSVGPGMLLVERRAQARGWPIVRGGWHRFRHELPLVWRWLHQLHHQGGLHDYNYADYPLWDMLFGTFRIPRAWDGRCGFGDGDGQENRLVELLMGRDISSTTRSGGAL